MIDRIYKFIQTISNNELDGNISPQEFNLELNNSVQEINEDNIFQLNRVLYKEKRGGTRRFSVGDLSGKLREKIMYYHDVDVAERINEGGKFFALPDRLRYLDTVEYNNKDVEPVNSRRHFFSVVGFKDTKPSLDYPIYLRIANKIMLEPYDFPEENDTVTVWFLRKPKYARWTYQNIQGTEVYNPDAEDFQDVDIHNTEEYNLTVKLLHRLGINLKEQQLSEYGIRRDEANFNEENA